MTREQLEAGWKLVSDIEETERVREHIVNNTIFLAAGLGDKELENIADHIKKPSLNLLDARLALLRAKLAAL